MSSPLYDVVFRGGRVLDGSGSCSRFADVAVLDGRIVAVDLDLEAARWEVDARGKCVAPGFIDAHSHDDRAVLSDPVMAPKISQGITTVVTGNCGVSLAPFPQGGLALPPLDILGDSEWYRYRDFGDWTRAVHVASPAVNVHPLVGHTTLRLATMESTSGPASRAETARMVAALERSMEAGAHGLSTGLYYPTARGSSVEEIRSLVQRVADRGGVYSTHLRDEGAALLSSLKEAFDAALTTGVRLNVSHHKCAGRSVHGWSELTLPLFDAAAMAGAVGFDVYPYTAASTTLLAERIAESDRILITRSAPHPEVVGGWLDEIASWWLVSEREALERLKPGGAAYFMMAEQDVARILAHRSAVIGTDGIPHDPHPHPRLWGTFPRILSKYVREEGLLPLEAAVHAMTGRTAARFGMSDRGLVRDGFVADLVMFDPKTVGDRATFESPTRSSSGIDLVLVAGSAVWRDGAPTGRRPGRVI